MSQLLTSAYTRFSDLHGSSQFLDFILNNISSCVLMLNKEMKLQAFNNPLKTLFLHNSDRKILYQRCGEVLGCAYSVEENADCGKTSHCHECNLRETALKAYANHSSYQNMQLIREFYTTEGKKEIKNLRFSVKPIYYEDCYYLLLIIDDITNVVEDNSLQKLQQNYLKRLPTN